MTDREDPSWQSLCWLGPHLPGGRSWTIKNHGVKADRGRPLSAGRCDQQAPALRTHVLDERCEVREHVHLFLNETDVRDDLAATTRDDDEIYVLQAVSGS